MCFILDPVQRRWTNTRVYKVLVRYGDLLHSPIYSGETWAAGEVKRLPKRDCTPEWISRWTRECESQRGFYVFKTRAGAEWYAREYDGAGWAVAELEVDPKHFMHHSKLRKVKKSYKGTKVYTEGTRHAQAVYSRVKLVRVVNRKSRRK